MFRANLGTDAAARTQGRIDIDPVFSDIKRGTCQVVDAISVSFAFFTDKKGFPARFLQSFGEQYTGFPGDNHRNPLIHQGFLDGIDALFHTVRTDDGNMFHTHPGMGLMSGHCRDAVVENNQGKIVIVKYGIDQSGNPGMKKRGISYKRDDLFA